MLLLFGADAAHSQERRREICVDFRVNSTVIDSTYSDNAARMREIIGFLQRIRQDSTTNILEVSFCGSASPEGSAQINRRLAQGRLTALERLVRKEVDIPDSLITRNDSYIPWDYLQSQVEASSLVDKEKVIAILKEESRLVDYHHPNAHIDQRIKKLQQLNNGKVWQQMNRLFFSQMRNASAVFVTYKKELPAVPHPMVMPDTITVEQPAEVVDTVPESLHPVPEVEGWSRRLHLKTNLIGLGMAMANLAAEIDLGKHWSFALPVYYSAWNYFNSGVKFRTLCFQPEARYWFNESNEGWFVGAHFSLAWYNYAKGGDWRYQDHDRRTPLLGGGFSGGYRMPVSQNHKWWLEFALGAGACKLHYDIFHNDPNGQRVDTRQRTFYGLDQVAVSLAYRFDLKKGGKR